MLDDAAIRGVVDRLARPDGAGGRVIERAAILAAGSDSAAILARIEAHDGRPEAVTPAATAAACTAGGCARRSRLRAPRGATCSPPPRGPKRSPSEPIPEEPP